MPPPKGIGLYKEDLPVFRKAPKDTLFTCGEKVPLYFRKPDEPERSAWHCLIER
jgi:hypothetical protein